MTVGIPKSVNTKTKTTAAALIKEYRHAGKVIWKNVRQAEDLSALAASYKR